MNTLQEITDYIWTHQPIYHSWPVDIFEAWVKWHNDQGFIQTIHNFDGSLCGLVIVRPIMEPEDAQKPYEFDPEGRGYYIAEVISTAKGAIQALGIATLKRFGMREFICYRRPPFYVTEVHSAKALRRNLFRKEAHLVNA